jgi:hypothetical protein
VFLIRSHGIGVILVNDFSVDFFFRLFSAGYLLPCPFTGCKMCCAGPNFMSQPKNLTTFSVSSKTFVSAQKPILLNANHLFVWHKMFVMAQYLNKFLFRHKKLFGLAQRIF